VDTARKEFDSFIVIYNAAINVTSKIFIDFIMRKIKGFEAK
jgi:hypothetical protein